MIAEKIAVPLLDLKAQYATIRAEIQAAMNRVMDSQHFVLGPEVASLEREVADYSGCAHAIGSSSGTDALLVSLMAIDLAPGDEVVTTPYTFFATAGGVVRLGGRPVFVDIDPGTFNIDASRVDAAVTARTRAILPVHLFGQMADMRPLMDIAGRHGLRVIEDAAQAIGAEYLKARAGSIGDLGCFSFFPSKNLGAFGDGGMVTSNDAALADRVRLLSNHGYRPKYFNKEVGGNFRLDALQAAILRVKLNYLDGWTAGRQANAALYRRLFAATGLAFPGTAVELEVDRGVLLPEEAGYGRHIYNQFVIRVPSALRDGLIAHLKAEGIGSEVYYPVPQHLQECFADLGYRAGQFPHSELAARQSLAIPVYPEMSEAQAAAVVVAVADYLGSSH